METHVCSVGDSIVSQFPVFASDGISYLSGISPSSFQLSQFRNNVAVPVTASVAEIGATGVYQVTFSPSEPADWLILAKLDVTGDVWGTHVKAYMKVAYSRAEAQLNVAYDEDSAMLYMEAWLERDGELVTLGLASATVTIYDITGVALFTEVSAAPKVDGRFSLSRTIALTENQPYNAVVSIQDSLGLVQTGQAFTTVG